MRVGILDLLVASLPATQLDGLHNRRFKKHLTSIMPQALAVWCRQLGHTVSYATFYGQQEPHRLLPDDLDVVFISSFSHASALAYALAKWYRGRGVLTVIGGPHARAFPVDCSRFFDIVVRDCDKTLVDDLLRGSFRPPAVITSGRSLDDLPSVEERMPEIRQTAFTNGRRHLLSNVPMLSSVGCPYTCNFCTDWDNKFVLMPMDRFRADLHYIARHLPGILVAYHDPNFAVKFDAVMEVIETIPRRMRNPYAMGSSLTILRGERMRRLRDTNCAYLAPGIESWADYSNKAGVGARTGLAKLDNVVAHFQELHEYVAGLGACFIYGTDADAGDEPMRLTTEFIRRVPFVWPQMNIPMPYGGTPMFDRLLAEERVLRAMPFSFYYTPHMVITLQNYSPLEYYNTLVDFYTFATSARTTARRLATTPGTRMKVVQMIRTLSLKDGETKLRQARDRLRHDAQHRAFHEGRSRGLPDYYRTEYRRRLGPYAELMTDADMTPDPAQMTRDELVSLETRVTG